MVSSAATTVKQYLEALPDDRRSVISSLRAKIKRALPKGFAEVMQYGMISYVVPLAKYPDTYNKQPLTVLSLASQKQHMSLYLLGLYGDAELRAWFEKAWAKTGKKLKMGKSCLRFRRVEELEVPLVLEAVGKVDVDALIAMHEAARAGKKKAARSR
jgi:hypothetical protein